MIKETNKNLWDFDSEQYYRVITTNGDIKKNGKAVMGKGIALQAAERYPELPVKLANHIKLNGNVVGLFKEYGIITFPSKDNWRSKSTFRLIRKSCNDLRNLCYFNNINKIVMTEVGCLNGGLDWNRVRKVVYDVLYDENLDVIITRV